MKVLTIRTPGLGDATYLLIHQETGVLVDPQRDVGRFLQAAEREGVRISHVLETHLHNDYVSGGREAARRSGAALVLPAGAAPAFDHVPAFHLEEFVAGALRIRPLHTPGHTPEHVSYVVLLDGQPVAVFSGGSVLVGAAGRSDLLGEQRAHQLALAQFRSVRRLAALPDDTGLYPTHGAGSFCAASQAGRDTSRIGWEKRHSPVLQYADGPAFARGERSGLGPYPAYYAHMGALNLLGPEPLPATDVPELAAGDVHGLIGTAQIVDGRPRDDFVRAHIPGALGIELSDKFGVWVGWLLPFNAPLVLVLSAGQDAAEAVTQLARIGFDRVRGVLRGLDDWRRNGLPVTGLRTASVEQYAEAATKGQQLLDVRMDSEWDASHIDGLKHTFVADLAAGGPADIDSAHPLWVACASGFRAAIAGSLLARAGYQPVVLADGGVDDVQAAKEDIVDRGEGAAVRSA